MPLGGRYRDAAIDVLISRPYGFEPRVTLDEIVDAREVLREETREGMFTVTTHGVFYYPVESFHGIPGLIELSVITDIAVEKLAQRRLAKEKVLKHLRKQGAFSIPMTRIISIGCKIRRHVDDGTTKPGGTIIVRAHLQGEYSRVHSVTLRKGDALQVATRIAALRFDALLGAAGSADLEPVLRDFRACEAVVAEHPELFGSGA